MKTKHRQRVDETRALYDETFQSIINSKDNFRKFLDFQASLYKYKFEDALLIYGNNPNATAVATFDQWNRINRRIHKGSKAIRIFSDDRQSKFNYVFDIKNTRGKTFEYPIKFTIQSQHRSNLLEKLDLNNEEKINIEDFNKIFKIAIERYVNANYNDIMDTFAQDKKDSIVENLPEYEALSMFKETVTDCVGYICCEKFGIPHGMYDNDLLSFKYLDQFNTKPLLTQICTISNQISRNTIDHIKIILEEERKIEDERTSIENDGRPHSVETERMVEENSRGTGEGIRGDIRVGQPDNRGRIDTGIRGRKGTTWEIRQDVPDIYGGEPLGEENIVSNRGNLAGNLPTSGRGSQQDVGGVNGAVQTEISTPDDIHGNMAIGDSEEGLGRGNNLQGDSLHKKIDNNNTLRDESNISNNKNEPLKDIQGSFLLPETVNNEKNINTLKLYEGWLEEHIKTEAVNYKEPYVVIKWSESNNFEDGEYLTFTQADLKFKEIEKLEREERKEEDTLGAYHKTKGYILFKENANDDELSCYEFRYDIGDYEEKNSGLHNHVSNYWKEAEIQFIQDQKRGQYSSYIMEDFTEVKKILSILEPYKYRESSSQNSLNQLIKNSTPAPIFFEDFNAIKKSIDISKYGDGDVIGYNKDGVKYSVSKIDDNVFLNTETFITPRGDILGEKNIPSNILEQIRKYQNAETPEKEDETWSNQQEQEKTEKTENQIYAQDIITDLTQDVENQNTTISPQSPINFTIKSQSDIGISSGKGKFQENIEAIALLKTIESKNRLATQEEQHILAKFSGWGGIPQAFDTDNINWLKEYNQLKELLTDEQYSLAKGSTLNAHYTGTDVINAMYKGLERMGVTGGNVLEPSMGVGNFFGSLPEYLKEDTKLYGVELDEITGRLAKQLYPNANIQISGFEKSNLQQNFFDIAIGNIPFGNYKVSDPKFNKHNFLIHDYFIASALDKVKPEGVIAFITSKGTMDKENSSARQYIAERAELLGVIRLPNNAFKQVAQTEVTCDILFLKKRNGLVDCSNESWVNTKKIFIGKENENQNQNQNKNQNKNQNIEEIAINQYFIENPHMMLGEMKLISGQFGFEPALVPFSETSLKLSVEERPTIKSQ